MSIIGNLMYAVGFRIADRGLRDTESKLGSLTGAVTKFGIAGAAAMVGFGIGVFHAASKFDEAMAHVQQTTGATTAQMEATKGIAQNLYNQNFGEDWADLASAISTTQQITKKTGMELENTTKNALLMRDVFGFDIPESVKTTDTMVKNFGITSNQAFNLLAQGAQKGLDKSGELLDSANEYAPQFAALGFTGDQMFDTFNAGLESGAFNLDKVGDAVKEFNIRAKDGSKSSATSFQMLGLDAAKMSATFAKGGPAAKKAFAEIVSMISSVEDPVAKNTIGIGLFGTQFEDLQADVIGAMGNVNSQFNMTQNSMDDLNKNGFSSFGKGMSILGRQIETGVLIPVGDKLLPYVKRFSEWMTVHKPTIDSIGAAIGGTLGGALSIAADSVKFLYDQFNIASPYIADFSKDAVAAIQDFIDILIDNKGEIEAVALVLTAVFGPALVKTGIQSVVTGAQITKSFIASTIKSGYEATKTAAITTGQLVVSLVKYAAQGWATLASITATTVAWVAQKAVMIASTALTWGMTAATWAYNTALWANPITWIVAGIIALIVAIVLMIKNWDWVKEKALALWGIMKDAWGGITGAVTNAASIVGDKVIGMWDGIKNGFKIGINFIVGLLNGMIDSLNDALSIKLPDWLGGKEISVNIPHIPEMAVDGSHAMGLDYVPKDGYIAELHEGERVLTADENKAYNSPTASPAASGRGGAVSIAIPITIEIKGGSAPQIANDIASKVEPVIQKIIESAFRRMGIAEVST